jgi:hypothetical protein
MHKMSFADPIKAPWDTNGDGILQKNEADRWWLLGRGEDIYVDNKLIDWSGLEMPLTGDSDFAISTTDAFTKLPWETASTYGGTSFSRVDSTTAVVRDQPYHYNMRPNNSAENVARNLGTLIGTPMGSSGGFPMFFKGVDYTIHYLNPTIRFK